MKLRKTVYPFSVIIALPLVMIVIFLLNQGHFEQVTVADTNENKDAINGYFGWKGFGHPKVKSVKINNGKMDLVGWYATKKNILDMTPERVLEEVKQEQPDLSIKIKPEQSNTAEEVQIDVQYMVFGMHRKETIRMK